MLHLSWCSGSCVLAKRRYIGQNEIMHLMHNFFKISTTLVGPKYVDNNIISDFVLHCMDPKIFEFFNRLTLASFNNTVHIHMKVVAC